MRYFSTVVLALVFMTASFLFASKGSAAESIFGNLGYSESVGAPEKMGVLSYALSEIESDSGTFAEYDSEYASEFADVELDKERAVADSLNTISWGQNRRGLFSGEPSNRGFFFVRGQAPPAEIGSVTSVSSSSATSSTTSSSGLTSNLSQGTYNSFASGSTGAPPVTTTGDSAYVSTAQPLPENATLIQRIFQYGNKITARYTYICQGKKETGLGVSELDAHILFAIPCESCKTNSINGGYFLIKPNFKYTYFNYPKIDFTQDYLTDENGDIVYDEYGYPVYQQYNGYTPSTDGVFDLGATTMIAFQAQQFSGQAEVEFGLSGTCKKITCDSFYVRGRGWGALPVDTTGTMQIFGGVAYYGRIKYKLVPLVGLQWYANERKDFFQISFPEPEWQHFLGNTNNNSTAWWFFVHGEIGGGCWLMRYENEKGEKYTDRFDYDDYQVTAGVNFKCQKGLSGSLSIGGSFRRELLWSDGSKYRPDDAFLARVNLGF